MKQKKLCNRNIIQIIILVVMIVYEEKIINHIIKYYHGMNL
jgi:hypothetical protein